LGNRRPKRLRETENAVWTLLFSMAAGAEPKDAFRSMIEKFEQLDRAVDSIDGNWFTASMVLIYLIICVIADHAVCS
jgi:hypothetical protein